MGGGKKERQLPLLSPLEAAQIARRRRIWLLVFLLVTTLPSLVFWLLSNFHRRNSKMRLSNSRHQQIERKIMPLLAAGGGQWGIWLRDLDGDFDWQYNAQNPFPAASSIKLPVAILITKKIAAGELDKNRKIILRDGDKQPGNGSLRFQPPGTGYSLWQLLKFSLQQSDNTAFHLLCNQLDRRQIDNQLRQLGLSETSFQKDKTTAAEIGGLWEKLLQNGWFDASLSRQLIGWMEQTPFGDYSPARLQGLVIAHKIGVEDQSLADSGVIFLPQHRLIFVFLGQGISPQKGRQVIQKLALASVQLLTGKEEDF